MHKAQVRLGPLETRFLSWAQLRRIERVRTGDLVRELGLTPIQEANLFRNMTLKGLLVKVMRGFYLVPKRIPVGKKWLPSPYQIVAALMEEVSAKYQVTGLAAFNNHALDTQVPNEIAVYNTALSGRKRIAGLGFNFIKVSENRLGGTDSLQVRGESGATVSVQIASLPRCLLDATYDYERFGTIPRVYSWIAQKRGDSKTIRGLVEMAKTYGNIGTNRRLGYLLDSLKVPPQWFKPLQKTIPTTTSLIPFIPSLPSRGSPNRKWGIIENGEIPKD